MPTSIGSTSRSCADTGTAAPASRAAGSEGGPGHSASASGTPRLPHPQQVNPARLSISAHHGRHRERAAKRRDAEVRDLVARGDFGCRLGACVCRKGSRHIARAASRASAGRQSVTSPSRRSRALVRGAWLLDAAGDVGNRQQIEAAYFAFSPASTDVVAAFAMTMFRAPHVHRLCIDRSRADAAPYRAGQAHKPITSPFTYNDDVFPILRRRCAALPCPRRRRADVADDVR